jgi:hypothetical protein
MTAAMFWTFQYIVEHTIARWIFMSDDDILINFDLLPAFMSALDRKYDPIHDVVVRGDCIMNGPVYPQGGSGVILSRRAVEQLAPLANYSIWGFWEGCPDQRLGHVMNKVFSGTSWYTSTAFLGQPLEGLNFESARSGIFTKLPSCPDPAKFSHEGCQRFLAPVRQIVFYHVGTSFHNEAGWLKERFAIAHNLWKAPPQVSFWPSGSYMKTLCWREWQNVTRYW